MDRMAAIRNLAENAPPVAQRESLCIAATVASIRVEGATADLERRIKNRYRYWIGEKPLSNINMVREQEIGDQEDVLAVDYRFEEAGENLDVIFVVQRNPELEINFGGYTTNLHPHRWVYIHGVRRDLFTDGDSLRFNARWDRNGALTASYLTSRKKARAGSSPSQPRTGNLKPIKAPGPGTATQPG